MSRTYLLCFLIFCTANAQAQTSSPDLPSLRQVTNPIQPVVTYLADPEQLDSSVIQGPYRILRIKGRTGFHPASIRTRLAFSRQKSIYLNLGDVLHAPQW
ncbi:hypothetical protein BH23BAC1_BH23BAC1_06280 [soil metagenome]